jgi:hypothetical protein
MLSRKEFLKEFFYRVCRMVNGLSGRSQDSFAGHDKPDRWSDLPSTELSPSLLAIEAELRGVKLEAGNAEELQREIYQKMAQYLQNEKTW